MKRDVRPMPNISALTDDNDSTENMNQRQLFYAALVMSFLFSVSLVLYFGAIVAALFAIYQAYRHGFPKKLAWMALIIAILSTMIFGAVKSEPAEKPAPAGTQTVNPTESAVPPPPPAPPELTPTPEPTIEPPVEKVPDLVVGMPLDEAEKILRNSGWIVQHQDMRENRSVWSASNWVVLNQNVSGETVVLGIEKYTDEADAIAAAEREAERLAWEQNQNSSVELSPPAPAPVEPPPPPAPIYAGDPGFEEKFDRDKDGIGCE